MWARIHFVAKFAEHYRFLFFGKYLEINDQSSTTKNYWDVLINYGWLIITPNFNKSLRFRDFWMKKTENVPENRLTERPIILNYKDQVLIISPC